ncbi:helix-turn-helix transcriptional regulator [Novosphingobium sp. JCM 18896]|uniref:helix-turn-helix transcriptional regulator n=1 Tax=Novosphingobium sp. JCM 18896 TaxID=2989731 RepID=UPI002221FFE6|nr:LuxR C-terminal-related transcriptional regulator [Novosphingobium sp. JCM 18896]MCW1432276.1 LuxR C-terminal-related transcriptional regulator [Novosphingobium sp. JCM 18896]
MRERAPIATQLPSTLFQCLPSVIDSLGDERFGQELVSLLNATCGAEHCTLFRFNDQQPSEILAASRDGTDTAHRQFSLFLSGSYWRNDAGIAAAMSGAPSSGLGMKRTDIRALPAGDHRNRLYGRTHIRERILLWGSCGDSTIALSILRPEERGLASDGELSDLGSIAATLMSLVAKHTDIIDSRARFSLALTSLAEIEMTMERADVQLPKREAQVCARIVFGISTAGIAVDLGVGEETVMTYRKRAYQRLVIGSQRELLLWYIEQWSAMMGRSSYREHASRLDRKLLPN